MGQTTSTHGHSLGEPDSADHQEQDYTSSIPDGCLALIFQRLSSDDRNRCLLVCRRWLTVEGHNRHRLALNASTRVTIHLPAIFTRFDSVTQLALHCDRNSVSINDHALILISQRCRNLTRLKLRRCREVSDVGILALAQNCKSLRKFSCTSCTFGAKGMDALLNNCSSLQQLSVKRLRGIKDGDGAEQIGPGIAGATLKSIKLKKLYNGQSFVPVVTESKNLTMLKILSCSGNWDGLLHSIARRKNLLREIHLEKLQVSDVGLISISKCSNLEVFHLGKALDCSNEGISAIANRCKLLKKLHIDGCRSNQIGDWGLMEIAKNSVNLVKLVLVGVNPSVMSLIAIASNCRKLETLGLCGSKTIGDHEISCMAVKCRALKKLLIKRCRVTDSGIEAAAYGCPNLVKIKVDKCRGVSRGVVQLLRERRGSLHVDLYVDEGEAKVMNAKVVAILLIFTFYLILLLRNYLI